MLHLNLQEHGVELMSGLISDALIQDVISEVNTLNASMPKYGIRNAEKKLPSILKIVNSTILIDEARKILGAEPKLVRAIFFDKTTEKNWLVPWHQDKTVTVNKKFNLEGWQPWTLKDDVIHVQPPVEVLNKMVTFRLHLDPTNDENGCLKIIPSSHRQGILKQQQIDEVVLKGKPVLCVADVGDTVIMRPHILHSSSKALLPQHRRIVHLEFSSFELPEGIAWA